MNDFAEREQDDGGWESFDVKTECFEQRNCRSAWSPSGSEGTTFEYSDEATGHLVALGISTHSMAVRA